MQNEFGTFKGLANIETVGSNVTTNSCLCAEGIEDLESSFYATKASVWVHEYLKNEDDLTGKLYLKGQNQYFGDIPASVIHKNHLSNIHPTIIADSDNNSPASSATEKHFRITIRNISTHSAINDYDDSYPCEVSNNTNGYYLTPAAIPIDIPVGATGRKFSDDSHEEIPEGALISYSLADKKVYRAYHFEIDKFLGYYNDINGIFEENLSVPQSALDNVEISIPYICDNTCKNQSKNLDYSAYTTIPADGGYNLTMEPEIPDALEAIGFEETKEWLLELFSNVKDGETFFFYPVHFGGKTIMVEDVYIGDTKYDFIGVSFREFIPPPPDAILFPTDPIQFQYDPTLSSFKDAIIFDDNSNLRITCFSGSCERINPSYDNDYNNPINFVIPASTDLNQKLYDYLTRESDNLLLFVNGYRIQADAIPDNPRIPYGSAEYNNTVKHFGLFNDTGSYWNDVGVSFAERIKTQNILYIDGHNGITTSNHNDGNNTLNSKLKFGKSAINSFCAAGKPLGIALKYLSKFSALSIFNGLNCEEDCSQPQPTICNPLNDIPNVAGFYTRFNEGLSGGILLWADISGGNVKVLMDENNKILGKIDIVAHSFGFAHALGVLSELNKHMAPPAINWADFMSWLRRMPAARICCLLHPVNLSWIYLTSKKSGNMAAMSRIQTSRYMNWMG